MIPPGEASGRSSASMSCQVKYYYSRCDVGPWVGDLAEWGGAKHEWVRCAPSVEVLT